MARLHRLHRLHRRVVLRCAEARTRRHHRGAGRLGGTTKAQQHQRHTQHQSDDDDQHAGRAGRVGDIFRALAHSNREVVVVGRHGEHVLASVLDVDRGDRAAHGTGGVVLLRRIAIEIDLVTVVVHQYQVDIGQVAGSVVVRLVGVRAVAAQFPHRAHRLDVDRERAGVAEFEFGGAPDGRPSQVLDPVVVVGSRSDDHHQAGHHADRCEQRSDGDQGWPTPAGRRRGRRSGRGNGRRRLTRRRKWLIRHHCTPSRCATCSIRSSGCTTAIRTLLAPPAP